MGHDASREIVSDFRSAALVVQGISKKVESKSSMRRRVLRAFAYILAIIEAVLQWAFFPIGLADGHFTFLLAEI